MSNIQDITSDDVREEAYRIAVEHCLEILNGLGLHGHDTPFKQEPDMYEVILKRFRMLYARGYHDRTNNEVIIKMLSI